MSLKLLLRNKSRIASHSRTRFVPLPPPLLSSSDKKGRSADVSVSRGVLLFCLPARRVVHFDPLASCSYCMEHLRQVHCSEVLLVEIVVVSTSAGWVPQFSLNKKIILFSDFRFKSIF